MPVRTPQLEINPYTSTVPLVPMPPAMQGDTMPAQPLRGEFGAPGTGALAIGDSILKGFLQGHQYKQERKMAQAQTTIAAADAASEAAYNKYQDALTAAGGNEKDPKAQAAYQAYLGVFNQSKAAKAQFLIPEKEDKRSHHAGKGGKEGGLFHGIHDWFAANPQIVPQIAIATMTPKPQGLSLQGQQGLATIQREKTLADEENQKIADLKQRDADLGYVSNFQSLTPEQLDALPPDTKQKLAAAKYRLQEEQPPREKFTIWESPDGKQFLTLPEGEQPPAGYAPWQRTTAGTGLGSEDWTLRRAAQLWNIPVGELTPADKNYLDSMGVYAKKRATLLASASGTTVDIKGNRESWVRQKIGPPPSPPPGRAAIDPATLQPTATGKISAPPSGGETLPAQPPGAINQYRNPEDQPPQVSYNFNKQWAKPGPYSTNLGGLEGDFRKWAAANPKAVAGEVGPAPDFAPLPQADYDVRGHWLAAHNGDPNASLTPNTWDGKLHGSDKWKTPYDGSFSNESIYALPNAPHWKGHDLVDSQGRIVTSEPQTKQGTRRAARLSAPPAAGTQRAKRAVAPPPGQTGDTAYTMKVKRDAAKAQQTGYQQAHQAYDRAIAAADKAYETAVGQIANKEYGGDRSQVPWSQLKPLQDAKNKAYADAKSSLDQANAQVGNTYDEAIRSIGGTPGDQSKPEVKYYKGRPYVRDAATGEWRLQQGQ